MSDASGYVSADTLISPADFERSTPRPPSTTSTSLGWTDVTVQRYSLSRCQGEVAPARQLRIGLHHGGPMQVDLRTDYGRHETRWLEPKQFYLIPVGHGAVWDFRGKPELLVVHFDPGLLESVVSDVFGIDPRDVSLSAPLATPDTRVASLAQLLLAEAEADLPGTQLFASLVAHALALHLLRHYSSLRSPQGGARSNISTGRVGRVIEFMQAHLAADLTLDQLAGVANTGPSQFGRAFRAETGMTPYKYLIKVRVEKACDLLEHTALSMTDIGAQCGFGQPSHFSTMFRQTLGLTPREYRRARNT